MTPHRALIIGGARSGKSRLAEQRARDTQLPLTYVATATVADHEMQMRIDQHRADREGSGVAWQLIEEPLALGSVIAQQATTDCALVIDCLTLWLSNCLHHQCWPTQRASLIQALQEFKGTVFMVTNETGMGVVPMGQLTRDFVDQSGFLHQELAQLCEQVTLCVAGLPMELKR